MQTGKYPKINNRVGWIVEDGPKLTKACIHDY